MQWILIYLAIINVIAFVCYGMDKRKAVKHAYRVSESALIWLAIIGGTPGACLGMWLFRHKTKKAKFRYGIPVIFLFQTVIASYFLLR